jgi:hypothetical protein
MPSAGRARPTPPAQGAKADAARMSARFHGRAVRARTGAGRLRRTPPGAPPTPVGHRRQAIAHSGASRAAAREAAARQRRHRLAGPES